MFVEKYKNKLYITVDLRKTDLFFCFQALPVMLKDDVLFIVLCCICIKIKLLDAKIVRYTLFTDASPAHKNLCILTTGKYNWSDSTDDSLHPGWNT